MVKSSSLFLIDALSCFLSSTSIYLENKSIEDDYFHDIHELYYRLNICFEAEVLHKKKKTRQDTFALGQFVEGLIYCGMPRIAAIEAVAKWKKLSKTKVRTANEEYRKRYLVKFRRMKKFETHIHYSPYREVMLEWIKEFPDFPCDHVKAKKAFQSLSDLLHRDIFSEIKDKPD